MNCETCVGLVLPVADANFCDPDINYGQISRIFLSTTPMIDWTDLAEWTDRLDNTTATPLVDYTRYFNVIGDKPAPEKTEVKISRGRTVFGNKTHTINFAIDETPDQNYAFMQFLEENAGSNVRLWYEAGKYLYGGNEGICSSIDMDEIIPESDTEIVKIVGVAKWTNATHPERILNPMA